MNYHGTNVRRRVYKISTMSKTKIGLVQINNSFSNQDYLPYSVGLLEAAARNCNAIKDSIEFLLPIYKRTSIKAAVEQLLVADMIFFSTYVWNFGLSLEIARQVREHKQKTVIVFGGPQVPEGRTEEFLRSNSFIDIACHGEGDKIVPIIIENYAKCDWRKVPSISYIGEDGELIQTPTHERVSDLNDISSPYLEGVFDPLIKRNSQTKWIALWETNRGCPYACAYCDWGSVTKNKVYAFDLERLFREIDWFCKNKIEFIFCCDANFGILQRDIEIVRYVAEQKKKHGYPRALSVQSTKNFTEQSYEIFKIMSDAGLNKGVSLSLQSLNEDTLINTGRKNVSIKGFKEIQQRLTSVNIETFTDLILGLPCETYETFANGVSSVIENGQHNRVQFNNLSILPNTDMGNPDYQKKFGFKIIETKLINIHGSISSDSEKEEKQRLVVGTNTMLENDWVRTRIFGWISALLHFDKLLQIPFILLNKVYHTSFRELIEIFTDTARQAPVLAQILSFCEQKAIGIQNGESEFCESKEWLNIWWPADELILIKLCTEKNLEKFYKEAEQTISQYLLKRNITNYESLLHECIILNQNLIKLPFQDSDTDVSLSYNIWDVYYAALRGKYVPLKKEKFLYKIDRTGTKWGSWDDWCREVVWYGNKRGAYIYNVRQ